MNNRQEQKDASLDRAILRKENMGETYSGPAYHVAFSGTSNYLVHTGISMVSILENNRSKRFHFHLFINGIEPEDREKMEIVAHQWQCRITLYYVDDRFFKDMLHRDGIAAFFYRFLIPPVLGKEQIQRVLYLDGDIMCQNPLDDLMNIDLGDHIAACVEDTSPAYAEMRRKKVGTKAYFNSGMILIDINRWNEAGISSKAADMAIQRRASGKPLASHDQDILNILLDGHFLMVPKKYNYIYNMDMKGLFQKQEPLVYDPQAVLVHFAGIVKPWRTWVQDLPGVKTYHKFLEASPWRYVPLMGYRRHKDIHQAARHARRMGKYGKMMRLYGQYISDKFVKHD